MADRDILKKIGTGVYAGIDESLFGIPDYLLSKANKEAYDKFKAYRKGEGATAEKIGDVASILGDIAMIPLGGAGLAKIGGKLGLKGAKTAAKTAAKNAAKKAAANAAKRGVLGTVGAMAQAGKSAVPALGMLGKAGKAAAFGAARAGAETGFRSVINPDAEERDALRQNIGMAALLGAAGGGIGGGISWLRNVSKGGKLDPAVSRKITDELREANAMDTLQEMGIGRGYKRNLNKMMKNASEEYIMEDAQELAKTARNIWDDATRQGLDFPDLVKEAREKLGREYNKIYSAASANHKAIKDAVSASVVDGLTTGGKVDPAKLTGDLWKEILRKMYDTDGETQGKIDNLFQTVSARIKSAGNARTLNDIGDYVENQLRKIDPTMNPREIGSIAKGIRDSVFDAVEKNGGEALRDVNRRYRHLQTILDSLAFEAKRTMGQNYANAADGLANQLVSGNAINNLLTGAVVGGGTLAGGGDWKDAALATAVGVGAAPLAQKMLRGTMSKGISAGTKFAREAAATALDGGALDKAAKIANSKKGEMLTRAITKGGTYYGRGKDIPDESEYSDEQRQAMANEMFDERLAQRLAMVEQYNRDYPEYAIDLDEARRILEQQRAAWISKEGTLARIGDKNLSKLVNAADMLRAGATGQEAFYALRQLGLSEKEAEQAQAQLEGYHSKAFRDSFIRKLVEEQAATSLTPESYDIIKGGLV